MQGKQGERTLAPIQGFTLGVVGLAAALMLAGCGTSGSAGALDTNDAGPNSVSGEASVGTPSGDSATVSTEQTEVADAPSTCVVRSGVPAISDDRVAAVTEAIQRDADSIGLGTVHRVRVESEDAQSSLAVLDVTRNGAREVLGATVVRVKGAWAVTNVDLMRSAQALR